MELTDKVQAAILEKLSKSQSGLFATYDTLEDVQKYAINLLKSSSLQEREMAALIVMGIYHNTLCELLKGMVTETVEEVKGILGKDDDALLNAAKTMASGQYLTDYFPPEWTTWDALELANFIDANKSQDYETWDTNDIWNAIKDMAELMYNFRKSV